MSPTCCPKFSTAVETGHVVSCGIAWMSPWYADRYSSPYRYCPWCGIKLPTTKDAPDAATSEAKLARAWDATISEGERNDG